MLKHSEGGRALAEGAGPQLRAWELRVVPTLISKLLSTQNVPPRTLNSQPSTQNYLLSAFFAVNQSPLFRPPLRPLRPLREAGGFESGRSPGFLPGAERPTQRGGATAPADRIKTRINERQRFVCGSAALCSLRLINSICRISCCAGGCKSAPAIAAMFYPSASMHVTGPVPLCKKNTLVSTSCISDDRHLDGLGAGLWAKTPALRGSCAACCT
jgi:hypothetical protein